MSGYLQSITSLLRIDVNTLSDYILRFSQVISLLPVLVGAIYFYRLTFPFRVFFWYSILCAFTELIAALYAEYFENNMPLLHIFTVIEFLVLSTVYLLFMYKRIIARRIIAGLMMIFILGAILDAAYINGTSKFNSISHSLESFILVGYALFYYGITFKEMKPLIIWKDPMFWVSTGILVYFSLNMFFFLLFNLIQTDEMNPQNIAILHSVLNALSYFLYTKAFLCFKTFPKSQ